MGRSPKGTRLGGECKGMTDKEREELGGRGRSADVRGQSGIMTGLDSPNRPQPLDVKFAPRKCINNFCSQHRRS